MNCSQARALLATYRELKTNQEEAVALQEHLSTCEACRQASTQYERIGAQIRSLPSIQPSPDAHAKLMQTLAVEHVRFIQHTPSSAASTPTPAFLVPYVKDLGKHNTHSSNLVAFSSADTGPLPIVRPLKRRSTYQTRQFAIIGAAASFLMILMVGGLTSLLLLGSSQGHKIQQITNPVVVNNVRDVQAANFSTTATYPSIASGIVNGNNVFYTSYSSDQAANWDLEQFDKNTKDSVSLLDAPTTDELFILESSAQWLVWLQISPPPVTQIITPTPTSSATQTADVQPTNTAQTGEQQAAITNPDRQWSLYATYLGAPLVQPLDSHTTTPLISKQVFHPDTVPNWVNKPVQGVWLNDNQLFVAMIDEKGVSHLLSYQLEPGKAPLVTNVATTSGAGLTLAQHHIFTSPTASSDNSNIYWDDEWATNQDELQGDIWTLQKNSPPSTTTGKNATHAAIATPTPQRFQSDGMSFHPQIVADNLFFLSTNQQNNAASTTPTPTPDATASVQASITPGMTTTPEATATPTIVPTTPTPVDPTVFLGGSTKIDPRVFTPQIDDTIAGRIRAFTANGTPETLPQLDSTYTASAIQGGTRYLLWQNSAKSFEMYDVVGRYPVNVGSGTIPHDAAFLDVNDNTGVWVENANNNSSDSTDPNSNTVTFNTFTWPWPRENAPTTPGAR